ncbi:HNH endonuclease signature motif containing protein [Sphingopyxis sp.]|uniref:HNH endonuclease signature motif containing protein n=1 Tax=Sphingopyxis sp. TaxID=1908224 RepID=UPI00258337BB|nr:HNH endonuclease signature motif containing protein [Sphingopyxis sp.]
MSIFGKQHPNALGSLLSSFDSDEGRKQRAWSRCRPANLWQSAAAGGGNLRVDDYGNVIRWEDYGRFNSPYGWEIDHIQPSALGGSNHMNNLRALHCRANRSRGGQLGNALNSLFQTR